MKNKLKNRLLNNIGVKIVSILLAVIFWLVVMNVSDYSYTVRIDDIPVQQINGDVLDELDQVYDIASGDTVDIVVKGRRSVVNKLGRDDFNATADLSKMSITNTVQIFVTPKSASISDEISISCVDNTMKLNLEDKVAKQFQIKVKTEGEPSNGFAVGEIEVRPNIVTVEGPKSAVDKITEARADISVLGVKSTYTAEAKIVLYDAYGEPVVNDKISVNQEDVNLNVNVYPVKSVPVNVSTIGNAGTGYDIAEVAYQPQTVQIAGPKEKLDRLTSVDIDDVSVSGLTENFVTTVNINDYLPDGLFVASESSDIAISVTIEKLEEVTFNLKENDITLTGKDSGYTYEIFLSSDYKVIASGLEEYVEGLNLSAIKPSINCSDLSPGTNNNVTLVLKDADGVTYEIKGSITVTVESK